MFTTRHAMSARAFALSFVLLAGCPPATATCPDGFVLASDGRCVAMGDAGPRPDMGATDGAPADASADGGRDSGVDAHMGIDAHLDVDAFADDTGVTPDAFVEDVGNDAFIGPDTGVDSCVLATYYRDADADGQGTSATTMQACSAPAGFVANATDCNDACMACHVGGTEVCDGTLDEDCDTHVDEGVQATWHIDADHDGHGATTPTMLACTMPSGYVMGADDCDDTSAARYPGLAEICDGIDNDCNTTVENGFPCVLNASVACTTTCGSTGLGMCTPSCAVPTGAACTVPSEVCDNTDQDCDGLVDESVRVVRPRVDLGAGTAGIEVLATSTGFVAVYGTASSGVRAHRLDATGALVGSEAMVAPTSVFGATVTSAGYLVVAYVNGTQLAAAVFNASNLTTVTPGVNLTAASGVTEIRVVEAGGLLSIVWTDGTMLRLINRGLPTLAVVGSAVTLDASMRGDFDLAANGTRAILAYVTRPAYDISIRTFLIGSSSLDTAVNTLASGGAPFRRPAISITSDGGTTRLAVVWDHNGGTPSTTQLKYASYTLAAFTSALTAYTPATVVYSGLNAYTANTGTVENRALDLVYANQRWVLTWLGNGGTVYWNVLELQETGTTISTFSASTVPTTIDTTTSANGGTAIVAGTGARVLFTATQSGAAARAYMWGCGP